MVAIDDCELLLAGLPGRIVKGDGDGCEGGAKTGDAFGSEGDAVAVGVGRGVLLCDVGSGMDVEIVGWWCVGCCPA